MQLNSLGQGSIKRSKQRLERIKKSNFRRNLVYKLFFVNEVARKFRMRRKLRTLQLWARVTKWGTAIKPSRCTGLERVLVSRNSNLKHLVFKQSHFKKLQEARSFQHWKLYMIIWLLERKSHKSRRILKN